MNSYTFTAPGQQITVTARTKREAMAKANKQMDFSSISFYAWNDRGDNTFNALLGAWD